MTPLAFVDNEITEPKTKKNDARRPTGTTTASWSLAAWPASAAAAAAAATPIRPAAATPRPATAFCCPAARSSFCAWPTRARRTTPASTGARPATRTASPAPATPPSPLAVSLPTAVICRFLFARLQRPTARCPRIRDQSTNPISSLHTRTLFAIVFHCFEEAVDSSTENARFSFF